MENLKFPITRYRSACLSSIVFKFAEELPQGNLYSSYRRCSGHHMEKVYIVVCSKCDDYHRGRIVKQCVTCRRTDVQCVFEPNAFVDDPFKSKLPADCEKCHRKTQVLGVSLPGDMFENSHPSVLQATFSVRCVACNSESVSLPDCCTVNAKEIQCGSCYGKSKLVITTLPCQHVFCLHCFGKHLQTQFRLNKLYRVRGSPFICVSCPSTFLSLAVKLTKR